MPLSYSSGQAISFGAIRDYHSGSGAVSMRDFANGGSLIHKPTSDAGSTEQGYNTMPTQTQLDAGTHSININDHLRTTYARSTCSVSSVSDSGSSSFSPRSWVGANPTNTGQQGGYSINWSTGGVSHLENYLGYGITWNGVCNITFQVNTSGYYYIKGYAGGDGAHTHNIQISGSGLLSSDVNENWNTPNGGYAYSTNHRVQLNTSSFTVRVALASAQYSNWQASIFYLMPNGDIDTASKGSNYNHIYY